MNIWTLPKEQTIRVALLRLAAEFVMHGLALCCGDGWEATLICDRYRCGLNAYLYTYGQSQHHYGLQLHYPTEAQGGVPHYQPLEEVGLERLIELLSMHFDLI